MVWEKIILMIARGGWHAHVDILVDLKGYTLEACTEIMALRPAPVQVNYLGYPGTMACDFIDYIIGDPVVTPLTDSALYSETIANIPCYQINDTRRPRPSVSGTRSDHGLPEKGFVFCCFNNSWYRVSSSVCRLSSDVECRFELLPLGP